MCPNTDDGPAAAPALSGVSPTGGPASGSTPATVTGSGITGPTAVTFGATSAADFAVGSDTELTATSPAGVGTVDVTITTPAGTSEASPADQFTAPPSIGIHPPVQVDPIANASDAGAVGRAFIAPTDRPQVGAKALRDETDNP